MRRGVQLLSRANATKPGKDCDCESLTTTTKSESNNGKEKRRFPVRATARVAVKCALLVTVLVILMLLALLPFFRSFFAEINYFMFHGAEQIDTVLWRKRRVQPDQKILFFLHLSKCGGTSLIDAARASGLSVPIRNALVQRDWRCCGGDDSLQAQQRFAATSPYDFVANEGHMYDAMDTEHYEYVVTLRDSQSRYMSQWRQWQHDPLLTLNTLARKIYNPNPKGIRPHNNNLDHNFKNWLLTVREDNFIVRKICGSPCRSRIIEKFEISREQFRETLDRLERFESILFLEDFSAGYARFAEKHGWAAPEQKRRIRIVDDSKSSSSSSPSLGHPQAATTKENDTWDYRMSALDDALYEYAQRKVAGLTPHDQFTNKTQANLDAYFQILEGKK